MNLVEDEVGSSVGDEVGISVDNTIGKSVGVDIDTPVVDDNGNEVEDWVCTSVLQLMMDVVL